MAFSSFIARKLKPDQSMYLSIFVILIMLGIGVFVYLNKSGFIDKYLHKTKDYGQNRNTQVDARGGN